MIRPRALTDLLLLLFAVLPPAAAQQCRLTAPKNLHGSPVPDNPFPPSGGTGSPGGLNNTNGTTSVPVFAYGKDKIRGVNLGGWFVLEPWITPSIFQNTNNDAIIDEYTFGQLLDFNTAQTTLKSHWETWITEDDFKAIKAAGLNHVRIPLGYWSVPTGDSVAPYVPGAWPYFLQALNWAKANGLHVIMDLHGAPGSQNGYDNSGQRTNNPAWAQNIANVSRTIDVLTFIATEVGGMLDVIELLNEPAGFISSAVADAIRQFWLDAYAAVRMAAGNNTKVMIGDAFLGVQSWTNFLNYPEAQGVLMDYHEYQIFSGTELSRSEDEHITFACSLIPNLVSFDTGNLWTVLGEWSAASTDCAQWLNGRGVGARWDNTWYPSDSTQYFGSCDGKTGNLEDFSSDYKAFLRKYFEVQVEVGERVQGWVWWTWKAENADEWSYEKGLAGGWIPQDPTQRMYPNLCS